MLSLADRTASNGSLISNDSHLEVDIIELENKAREDNKMIEQEKAETGRVSLWFF